MPDLPVPGSRWAYRWIIGIEPMPESAIVEAGRVNPDGSVRDGDGVWRTAEEWHKAFVLLPERADK
jgi:hypothetical protein